MKQGNLVYFTKNKLVYILILAIAAFLFVTGYSTWQKRSEENGFVASAKNQNDNQKSAGNDKKISPATKYDVPILMYHYIRIAPDGDTLGKNLSVTPENFSLQMTWLKENNYATIKVSDLADPEKKEISKILAEGKKPIAITFDDGYEDAFTAAYPILKKNDFVGIFYIIRNFVGRPEYMNQAQIDELAADKMEIGSHTLSHPDLSKATDANQRTQIFDSKLSATSFCYPSGKFSDTTVSLVKEAGYTTATTTKIGIAKETSKLLELPRIRVEDGSAQTLLDKISYAFEHGSN